MRRFPSRVGIIRLLLVAALAGTLYKGFMKTPEAASNLTPRRFYDGLVNDGENDWPHFTVTFPASHPIDSTVTVEVSRDSEGNGPGFLFIGPEDETSDDDDG